MLNDLKAAYQHFSVLPSPMRLAYALGLVFFVVNVALLISQGSSASWRIDPGVATLIGAIVGLCVVAWQTGRGFRNLTRSQEHQAQLERNARLHQAEIERDSAEHKLRSDKAVLLSALRAEVAYLYGEATRSAQYTTTLVAMQKAFKESRTLPTNKVLALYTFDAPVFRANIPNLGLLGAYLGADIIKVLSRANGKEMKIALETPIPHDTVIMVYQGHVSSMMKWASDLFHVAMRIRAYEENTPDPGTLVETEDKRYKELGDD